MSRARMAVAQQPAAFWFPSSPIPMRGLASKALIALLALMRAEATKRGRHIGGKFLEATIQSAATYFSAVNILTAYDRAPSGVEPLVLAGGK